MARIRTIKPEFWSDERLAECCLGARLLFIGTWNFADDDGRMEYSAKRLKMQVFPGDNIDVTPLVEELSARKLVSVYRVGERDYLAIPNFRKHQRIDHPKSSSIPAPAVVDSTNETGTVQEDSRNDPRTLAPEWKGMEGNGIEGKGVNQSSERKNSSNPVSEGSVMLGKSTAPPSSKFNPTEIAQILCQQNGWSGRGMIWALEAALEFQAKRMPESELEEVGEWLLKAYSDHKLTKGTFAVAPQKFFEQGLYSPAADRREAKTSVQKNNPATRMQAQLESA